MALGRGSMRVILALLFFGVFLSTAQAQQALRPGDSIEISVWQDPKLDRRVVIGPDGFIGFPLGRTNSSSRIDAARA